MKKKDAKDWVYLLFRPKTEKMLFKLFKTACSNELNLDTILVDTVPSKIMDSSHTYKLSVDAFMFNILEVYDVSLTAQKEQYHDRQEICREENKCNVSVKDYIKYMADIIKKSDIVFSAVFNYLMKDARFLKQTWLDVQCVGIATYNTLNHEFDLCDDDFYAYGYPKFNSFQMQKLEQKVVELLDIPYQRPQNIILKNLATIMTYHISRTAK